MAIKINSLLSEDDIRTKVVYEWLKDCGVTSNELSIEYSIKLRLGRGIKTVSSNIRADILVRNKSGKNLLIIEVKKPNHQLNENDKLQAISYARSLADGGIAPFCILTNGTQSLIFDSITEDEISGLSVPTDHPYVKNKFKVNVDGIVHRAEALEYLISLSDDNLVTFCKGQVEYRIELLKGIDIFSGKKYIPSLNIERKLSKQQLENKLFNSFPPQQVILVLGPPQHGKTCFMCDCVEQFLNRDIPCLFYPAIALRNGLLSAIVEDFQWMYGQEISPAVLDEKLNKVLDSLKDDLIIFVDGWNEMVNDALRINDECQRLSKGRIKLVLSTTSPSINRVLLDEASNVGFIGASTKLNSAQIRKLTYDPLQNTENINLIQIGNFSNDEMELAKITYEAAYNVQFNEASTVPQDPFYLRLLGEQYSNSIVPPFATQNELIRESLVRKGARGNISEVQLFIGLDKIAAVITENDAPFSVSDLPLELSKENVISKWIECGILIMLFNQELPLIDFYFTNEKCYSIAVINKKWHNILPFSESSAVIQKTLNEAINTEAGKSSLIWFLSCSDYYSSLKNICINAQCSLLFEDAEIMKILTQCIFNQVNLNNHQTFDWLDIPLIPILDKGEREGNIVTETPELIYALLISLDRKADSEKYKIWLRKLLKYDYTIEEIGIEESFVGQLYGGEDIKEYPDYCTNSTFEFELFEEYLLDEDYSIASKASLFLAFVDFSAFLDNFQKYRKQLSDIQHDFKFILMRACDQILEELREIYYGTYCKGILLESEPGDAWVKEEYLKMKPLLLPIITTYIGTTAAEPFIELLSDLKKMSLIDEDSDTESSRVQDINQTTLDI